MTTTSSPRGTSWRQTYLFLALGVTVGFLLRFVTVRGNDGSEAHTNCCHPYDISVDWTNCYTECCNGSNAFTCANYGCTP